MLSSGFTKSGAAAPTPPPPLIGALLRTPFETVRERMLAGLHERGFSDLVAAHLDVFQYPGPDGQRPSELAQRARMSKQALNYLLGQMEKLGYLERRQDGEDHRFRRIHLTQRGQAAVPSARSSSKSRPTGNTSSALRGSRNCATSSRSSTRVHCEAGCEAELA